MIGKRYEILAKGFIRNKDIVALFGCSKAKASQILHKVRATMKEKWFVPFADSVPTQLFVDYVGWTKDWIDYQEAIKKAVANLHTATTFTPH